MAMSVKLKQFLEAREVPFDMVHHPYAEGAAQSAMVGHVPLAQMAKAIMLEQADGRSVMAVIPAADRIDMRRLSYLVQDEFQLAPEHHLGIWFDDCDPGAIPAVGEAFAVETMVDDDLLEMADIYMESGDNRDLVHISGEDFRRLASQWMHGHFCKKPDPWSRVERM